MGRALDVILLERVLTPPRVATPTPARIAPPPALIAIAYTALPRPRAALRSVSTAVAAIATATATATATETVTAAHIIAILLHRPESYPGTSSFPPGPSRYEARQRAPPAPPSSDPRSKVSSLNALWSFDVLKEDLSRPLKTHGLL